MSPPCWPPPLAAGAQILQLQYPLLRRAGSAKHAHPGHRRRHHQAGYDPGAGPPAPGGLEGRLVLQVHDELIVECPEAEAETVCKLVKEEMEGVCALSVPLLAETHAGTTWASAH